MSSPVVLAITGPTGSGKSAAALQISQSLNAEIVNADSVQIYKGFRIGANQPSAADKQQCAHHLYEVLDPTKRSDVGEYLELVDSTITELHSRAMTPLVVGGSGLYLRTLFHGLVSIPDIPEEVIEKYQKELNEISKSCSHSKENEEYFTRVSELLKQHDQRAFAVLHPSDTQRIVRALAVISHTGRSLFEFQDEHAKGSVRYMGLVIYLEPERDALYRQINDRVLQMWEEGLVEEVEQLQAASSSKLHPLGSIGYRHVLKYLNAEWGQQQAIEYMQRDTRRFAKRQMTWWRNQPEKLGWKVSDFVDGKLTLSEICRNYEELRRKSVNTNNLEVAFQGCRSLE